MLRLIAFTPYEPVDDEAESITVLLDSGWDMVHLRHPVATADELRDILDAIPSQLHGRIVLHDCFDLARDYGVGGLHLNSRCPEKPAWYTGCVSRSCHNIAELKQHQYECYYLTLSPVFDSISKPGYKRRITDFDIAAMAAMPARVVALGGVKGDKLQSLADAGFWGAAMLGAIPWEYGPGLVKIFTDNLKRPT